MRHALSDEWEKCRKEYEQLSDEELAGRMEGYRQDEAKMQIARIVFQIRQLKRQHDFQVKQIELQHQFNSGLAKEQTTTNRKFLKITVCATIGAAILGAVVGGTVQFCSQLYFQRQSQSRPQQTLQPQTVAPTSASHPGKTTEKVPSSPPK